MGVYIAEMSKPRICGRCGLYHLRNLPMPYYDDEIEYDPLEYVYPWCCVLDEEVDINKRPENCPLIEIDLARKPIKGYEGYYEVDSFGRVFSVERMVKVNDNGRAYEKQVKARQLKQWMHNNGYKMVSLTKDGKSISYYVHRLVAEAFIDNPNRYPIINHKDEDKTNNFVENLEWCTNEYNVTYGTAREKQAEALRGRKMPEETKKKISETNKETWIRNHGERRTDE
jgi:hypothetical protein